MGHTVEPQYWLLFFDVKDGGRHVPCGLRWEGDTIVFVGREHMDEAAQQFMQLCSESFLAVVRHQQELGAAVGGIGITA